MAARMSSFFLIAVFVLLETCDGMVSPMVDPRQNSNWPTKGFQLCRLLSSKCHLKEDCIACFAEADSNWQKNAICINTWLPEQFANCVNGPCRNNGNSQGCLRCLDAAKNRQEREKQRAEVLYTQGGKMMKQVADSRIIEDGAESMFSCIAQERLLNDPDIQPIIKSVCRSCLSRFQVDPANEQWHLGNQHKPRPEGRQNDTKRRQKFVETKEDKGQRDKTNLLGERTLVFDYGVGLGHDMPYHGVGPFALDYLKGKCIFECLADNGFLNMVLEKYEEFDFPMPPQLFRVFMEHIDEITLPESWQ